MFDNRSGPSRDAPPRQDSASHEIFQQVSPRSSDPCSGSGGLTHRSVVLSDAPEERRRRHFAASALSFGNVLYLLSIGVVATATIAVFFGAGFSLLAPPAGGTVSGFGTQHPGPGGRPLVYGLLQPAGSDYQTASPKLGSVALQPPVPGSDEAIPFSGVPVAPNPVADAALRPEKNGAAQNSAALPAPREVLPSAAEDSLPAPGLQTGVPTPKATSSPPAQSSAALDPAPPPLGVPGLASPNSRPTAAELTGLLGQGDALLRTGDVASARLFYERAAAAGDGRAALRLGATFDPAFLGRAGLRNAPADATEARSWYGRALDLGAAEAKRQLNTIETKQGR